MVWQLGRLRIADERTGAHAQQEQVDTLFSLRENISRKFLGTNDMTTGIVLFAHGSRSPSWAEPFKRMKDRIAARRPDSKVSLAYLELMSPNLHVAIDEQVGQAVTRITIVPLFLASGGHVQTDLPRLVEEAIERHPQLRIRVLPPIGESDMLLDAIAEWASTRAFEV